MNKKALFLGVAVLGVGFVMMRRGGSAGSNTFNENANVPVPALAGGTPLNASASPLALNPSNLAAVASQPSPTALLPPPQTYTAAPAPTPVQAQVDQRKYIAAVEPLDYNPYIDWSTIGGA